jgi:putative oxidoreductase
VKLLFGMTAYKSWVPMILRLALAILFFVHGTAKWDMWTMQPSGQMPALMLTIYKILSIAEPLGALALVLGIFTPLAAMGLSIVMFSAINLKMDSWHLQFMDSHGTGWELEFITVIALICLMLTGPGALSLDHKFWKV